MMVRQNVGDDLQVNTTFVQVACLELTRVACSLECVVYVWMHAQAQLWAMKLG